MSSIIYIPKKSVLSIINVNYGYLYNYYAVADARNIAPVGFHLPSAAEFTTLTNYLGGTSVAGGKLKEIGLTHWNSPNTDATNESGFSAVGGGTRFYNGSFGNNIKNYGYLFSSTLSGNNFLGLGFSYSLGTTSQPNVDKHIGYSIRFIADSGNPTTVTGNDGKIYLCVTIGTQTWIATNSAETKYRNGDWITGYDSGVYTPILAATWSAATTGMMCAYNDDETNAINL